MICDSWYDVDGCRTALHGCANWHRLERQVDSAAAEVTLRRSPEPAGSSKPLYRSTALAAEMELLYFTYAKPCSNTLL